MASTGRVVQHVRQVLHRMQAMPAAAEREFAGALDECAQLLARRMRMLAPKFRSLLAMGVRIQSPEPLVRDIGPTADYAQYQEEGIRSGGKGLPKFSDPDAANVIAWLRTKAFAGRRIRRNTMAAVRADLELRDRYEGLAWHIRHKGVKATPFVGKAFEALRRNIELRLQVAGERALQAGSQA